MQDTKQYNRRNEEKRHRGRHEMRMCCGTYAGEGRRKDRLTEAVRLKFPASPFSWVLSIKMKFLSKKSHKIVFRETFLLHGTIILYLKDFFMSPNGLNASGSCSPATP